MARWPEDSDAPASITDASLQVLAERGQHLSALLYSLVGSKDNHSPSLAPVLSLPHLVRLTLPAAMMDDLCVALFSTTRFPFLRCFQLHLGRWQFRPSQCPQTDASLRFFVKPPAGWTGLSPATVDERRGRQWKANERRWQLLYAAYDPAIFPFPALECLNLPYAEFVVSARMEEELSRCYPFDSVSAWEDGKRTVGFAEWRNGARLTRY